MDQDEPNSDDSLSGSRRRRPSIAIPLSRTPSAIPLSSPVMQGSSTSGFQENPRSSPQVLESHNLRIDVRGNRSPSLDGVSFLDMLASSKDFAATVAGSSRELPAESTPIHEAVLQGDAKMLDELLKKHITADLPVTSSGGKGKNDLNETFASTAMSPSRGGGKSGAIESRTKRVPSFIIDAQDPFGNTPLMRAAAHFASSDGTNESTSDSDSVSVAMIEMLLDAGADPNIRDSKGQSALHWAAACSVDPDGSLERSKPALGVSAATLSTTSSSPNGKVSTLKISSFPLNAARRVTALLNNGAIVDARSITGETPLHRACRFGRYWSILALIHAGADTRVQNDAFYAPVDVAGHSGEDELESTRDGGSTGGVFSKDARKTALSALTSADPGLRTLVLHHRDCLDHVTAKTKEGAAIPHQEAPERVSEILAHISDTSVFSTDELTISDAVPLADESNVTLAHSKRYFAFVKMLSKHVETLPHSVPFTPQIQRFKRMPSTVPIPLSPSSSAAKKFFLQSPATSSGASAMPQLSGGEAAIHPSEHNHAKDEEEGSDTTFSKGSFIAALRAVGAACNAVDAVVNGKARHVMCLVRPPGHHAGVEGLSIQGDSHQSCGFCIFNSVAIAALYAMKKHPKTIKRVAIIDIDIHHGNGTEEIVRKWSEAQRKPGADKSQALFFFSSHLYDVERPRPKILISDGGNAEEHGDNGESEAAPQRRITRGDKAKKRFPEEEEHHQNTASSGDGSHDSALIQGASMRGISPSNIAGMLKGNSQSHILGGVPVTSSAPFGLISSTSGIRKPAKRSRKESIDANTFQQNQQHQQLQMMMMQNDQQQQQLQQQQWGSGLDYPPQMPTMEQSFYQHQQQQQVYQQAPSQPSILKLGGNHWNVAGCRVMAALSTTLFNRVQAQFIAPPPPPPPPRSKMRPYTDPLKQNVMMPQTLHSHPQMLQQMSQQHGMLFPSQISIGATNSSFEESHVELSQESHIPRSQEEEFIMSPEQRAQVLHVPSEGKPLNTSDITMVAQSNLPGQSDFGSSSSSTSSSSSSAAVQAVDLKVSKGISGASAAMISVTGEQNKERSGNTSPPTTSSEPIYQFYPGTGQEDVIEANILNVPITPLWRTDGPRHTRYHNRGTTSQQSGKQAMQKAILGRLIPALRAFGPDLILISAGFDAGKGDLGNFRDSHGGMDLQADDFSWITSQILAISRICCPGRVVSVLEGGYGRSKWVPDTSMPSVTSASVDDDMAGTQSGGTEQNLPSQQVTTKGSGKFILNRDILVTNSTAHLRALVDGGGSMNA